MTYIKEFEQGYRFRVYIQEGSSFTGPYFEREVNSAYEFINSSLHKVGDYAILVEMKDFGSGKDYGDVPLDVVYYKREKSRALAKRRKI